MTFLKRNQALAVSAILLAASGCKIGPFEASVPDISGNWTFAASHLIDDVLNQPDGIVCDASGYQLVIDQNEGATTFTGTYSGGRLTCVLQGDTILDRSASGIIVNGIIGRKAPFESADMRVDFDTRADAHHEGFLNALSTGLGGNANWRVDFGGDIGRVLVFGSYHAGR